MKTQLYAGATPIHGGPGAVHGKEAQLDGERFHMIENYDLMRPFLMSIVSDEDHWMFISSTGALTAGRRNPDSALFPYYTEDRIHDSAGLTGSRSVLIVTRGGRRFLWEPFCSKARGLYRARRNLYKSPWGNKVIFEEINQDLDLTLRYGWYNSAKFGLVRRVWLQNIGRGSCSAIIVDGLQNVMASGVGSQFQLEKSNLLDAYRRSEQVPGSRLALFTYSSIPVDRPEPSEALKATTVWSIGPNKRSRISLSPRAFEDILENPASLYAAEVRGERGTYAVRSEVQISQGQTIEWLMAADVDRTHSDLANLMPLLRNQASLRKRALEDVERGTNELRRMVASADGLQRTALAQSDARHYANVLFNIMRGGVFRDGYAIDASDFRKAVTQANRKIAARHEKWLSQLPKWQPVAKFIKNVIEVGDPQLERIAREYLPLTFSRRHGDPSRPWNRFNIRSRNPDGTRALDYEGNWRDIFQNWEALAVSFPAYIEGMVCRFVNASTPDGYNPYRITRDGLDWEVVDPHDPWSFIGYWGDHQIIYLLKLLELLDSHDPGALRSLLSRKIFSFAAVPYRIADYAPLLRDPRRTVSFDAEADAASRSKAARIGSDGRLLSDSNGQVYLTNLAEKLLIPILVKLSNFIPDAGIWLNTQRPEWNDANNALVGNGVSMVTLCHLRRHFSFLAGVFAGVPGMKFPVSGEVADFFRRIELALGAGRKDHGIGPGNGGKNRDGARKRLLDALGTAGEAYRRAIYQAGFSKPRVELAAEDLASFMRMAIEWMDHSIKANKRKDGLYEAYNLVRFEKTKISIQRLYPMLEGQVAVLTSGVLSPDEALQVLRALRSSSLYRKDQRSYLLYPNRGLKPFLLKNTLAPKEVRGSTLIRTLLRDRNRDLVQRDSTGKVHFAPGFRNAADVAACLDKLSAEGYEASVKREKERVCKLFERLFDHETFTGRSGAFFAYEGLGSIYWHMVSKLLLAVQETFLEAKAKCANRKTLAGLAKAYFDIRSGLGDAKSPTEYGAFPSDPYSHTPAHKGATQPGLTGQVKEDILCRQRELGVHVVSGELALNPVLLRRSEFLASAEKFDVFTLSKGLKPIALPAGAMSFTVCQTPVVYRLATSPTIKVFYSDGSTDEFPGSRLPREISNEIFSRTGRVQRIEALVNESELIAK